MLEPRYAKAGQRIEAEEIEHSQVEDLALQCGEDPAPWPRVQDDPEFRRGMDLADRRDRIIRELGEVINAGAEPEYLLQALEAYFQVKE